MDFFLKAQKFVHVEVPGAGGNSLSGTALTQTRGSGLVNHPAAHLNSTSDRNPYDLENAFFESCQFLSDFYRQACDEQALEELVNGKDGKAGQAVASRYIGHRSSKIFDRSTAKTEMLQSTKAGGPKSHFGPSVKEEDMFKRAYK